MIKTLISLLLIFFILSFTLMAHPLSVEASGFDEGEVIKGLGIALVLLIIARYGRDVLADRMPEFTEEEVDEVIVEETVIDVTESERELLARVVHAEAEGEPYQGKVAVAAVVLNRVKHPNYPEDVYGVVFESNQFEPVRDGRMALKPGDEALRAVIDALAGEDPSRGALFFYNRETVRERDEELLSWFDQNTTITVRIGDHTFAR